MKRLFLAVLLGFSIAVSDNVIAFGGTNCTLAYEECKSSTVNISDPNVFSEESKRCRESYVRCEEKNSKWNIAKNIFVWGGACLLLVGSVMVYCLCA